MAIDLTTPDQADVVYQEGVVELRIAVPHIWDEANTKFKIDKPAVLIHATTQDFYSDEREGVPGVQPPITQPEMDAEVIGALRTLYNWVETYGQAAGWFGAGTGEDL